MMWFLSSIIAVLLIIVKSDDVPSETEHTHCKMTSAYPPPANRTIKWYDINLDLPAHDRWNEVVIDMLPQLEALIDQVFHMNTKAVNDLLNKIEGHETEILSRYPNDYGDEIQGISDISGIEVAKLIILNAGYELLGLCTSIVAQNISGHVLHGRNLDFGLGPGFNFSDGQWELTDVLKTALFNGNMIKNNQTLYKATFYTGYVGLLTGVRKQAMTISVDSRFDDNYDKYLMKWFDDPTDNSQWLSFTTRNAMESYNNYNDALNYMSKVSYIGPNYIIIGGSHMNEGAVLTNGPNNTFANTWTISEGLPFNDTSVTPWYVLETNYDWWTQPPWFDDRVYPAEDCMAEVTSYNLSIATLYNVLNGQPNRNRLTTYTAIMDCAEGHLESYVQYCNEKDCSPW